MRSPRDLVLIMVSAILAAVTVLAPAAGAQDVPRTAQKQNCTDRTAPPPPVDTSEVPKPGQKAPEALPVPATPIGGDRMGECGLVLPRGADDPPAVINSASWVLQDLDTGEILAAKDPHARQRPASLIKVLLALVAVNELDPARVITASPEDADQECTCVGLVAGGQYTVEQLLQGLLMHSGNDAAHALATTLGGVPATLEKMNSAAAKIGAMDTRAATPSGLDGPGMSSSAYDLSLIFHYAMKQPTFAKTVGTKQVQFPGWGDKPAFPVYNDNKLLSIYDGFLGGKTGFTDDARHTYLGAAQRQGKRLAVVTLRGEQKPMRVTDQAGKLLDYGFELAAKKPQPVGQLTYREGGLQTGGSPQAGPDVKNDPAKTAATMSEEDPFGTTGWIITLVVAVIIIAGFVVGHRRKRAALLAEQTDVLPRVRDY
ncbi:serine hydrolase [Amycolatopsis magusensis]|nr:serine hydrolase [Amycolatopsis magusensis]MDI5980506.1 serine hydrolase [Amycolatopsis magusensis]